MTTESALVLGFEGSQGHEGMRGGNQRESWYTVANLFPNPHRPTKLLIELAVHKSLKINKVGSRALASLLITERGVCGNWAENLAAVEATLATSLRFSLGEQAKKIPTDKSWDFEYWWCVGSRRQTAYELLMRANVGRCGALSLVGPLPRVRQVRQICL